MSRQKYRINENYFDIIDTEGKAYWLGFLYADGCNLPKSREVKLRLAIRDETHLLKLRDTLYPDGNRPLYYLNATGYHKNQHSDTFASCELYISNAHMSAALVSHGCTAAKTFSTRFPFDSMHPSLYRHFIRGVFDGDGSIVLSTLKSGQHKTTFSIIGNRPFMAELNHIIATACGINENRLISYKGKDERIATLVWTGCRQCMKIRDYLYQDATVYLERKWEKFQKLGTDEWRTYENCRKPKPPKMPHARKGIRAKVNTIVSVDDITSAIVISDKLVYIDTEDIAKVNAYTWHIEQGRVVNTHRIDNKHKQVNYLGRIIMDAMPGQSVKHLNNNQLDCRKINLKVRNHR